MDSCHLILFLLFNGLMRIGTALKLNLNLTELAKYQNSSLNVPIKSSVTLYCPNNTVQVYNVNKTQYDYCLPLTESNIQIGHCAKAPLSLNVHDVTIPGSVNYQVGKTYYYAIYDTNKGTGPCIAGYKFMIHVYEISSTMLKYAHISSSRLNIQSSFAPGITSTTDMNTEISTTDTNSYNTGYELEVSKTLILQSGTNGIRPSIKPIITGGSSNINLWYIVGSIVAVFIVSVITFVIIMTICILWRKSHMPSKNNDLRIKELLSE